MTPSEYSSETMWTRAGRWFHRPAGRFSGPLAYALASLLLLLPCFWQPRLGGGDLASHMYNSWLPSLFENGRISGVVAVHHWTNVLFDFMLSGLYRVIGPEAAQRLSVSLAVLTFVWGAFAFVSAVSGRRSWHLLPTIAMLAYGWVFHMGFFDFYLSLGLCFCALALAWNGKPWPTVIALCIFVPAYAAHALPVIWTSGLLTYVALARNLTGLRRVSLTTGFVLVLLAVHAILGRMTITTWSPAHFTTATGLDQVWVFDSKYYVVMMGLVAVWGLLFLSLIRGNGVRQVVASIPFQLCVISAAAVSILQGTVLIPGFYHALSFIAERMSLGVAVCFCAMLGAVRPRWQVNCALMAVALVFFGFVYVDERAQNAYEDRMQDVVSTNYLPEFGWQDGRDCSAGPLACRAEIRLGAWPNPY